MNRMLQICLGYLMNPQRFEMAVGSGFFDDALLIALMGLLLNSETLCQEKVCTYYLNTF